MYTIKQQTNRKLEKPPPKPAVDPSSVCTELDGIELDQVVAGWDKTARGAGKDKGKRKKRRK